MILRGEIHEYPAASTRAVDKPNTAPHGRDIDPDSPIGAIATSVVGAEHLRSTLAEARKDGRGVLVDTEAWREQLEPDDPQRAGEFRRLDLGSIITIAWRPVATSYLGLTARSCSPPIEMPKLLLGETILLSPYHRVRAEAPLGRGRRLDVTLCPRVRCPRLIADIDSDAA